MAIDTINQGSEIAKIRQEMQQQQEQAQKERVDGMDELLDQVASNLDDQEEDIRDDGRRHKEMTDVWSELQTQISSLLT